MDNFCSKCYKYGHNITLCPGNSVYLYNDSKLSLHKLNKTKDIIVNYDNMPKYIPKNSTSFKYKKYI